MSYSLRDVVTDGALTAPRWAHHLVKIATHFAIILLAIGLARIVGLPIYLDAYAALGGPVAWATLAVREHFKPSDPEPLTFWQHVTDWITDCSLSCVPLAFALLLGRSAAGVVLSAAILLGYGLCHRGARP